MTKFCTECGHENLDVARFCANCGKPFDEDSCSNDKNLYYSMFDQIIDSNSQSNENDFDQMSDNHYSNQLPPLYKDHEIIEKSVCFNCYQDTFLHLYKESFFSERWVYYCTHCGLTLEKRGIEFQLLDIYDKNSRIWNLYEMKTFSKSDWERIGRGGLPNKSQDIKNVMSDSINPRGLESQYKKDLENFVQQVSQGEIQLNPTYSPVILKKNEEAYFSIPNVNLDEAVDGLASQRTGEGPSFMVAKGLYTASSIRQSKRNSNINVKTLDNGTLVITNKRLVFLGSKKSVNINLNKIISIEAFENGISIQRENKQKIEYFVGTNKTSIQITIGGRKQTKHLEGYIIKAIILGQISKLSKKPRKVKKTNKIEMVEGDERKSMGYSDDVPAYIAHLVNEHEKKYGKTEKSNKIDLPPAEVSRAKIARNKAKFLK